MLLTLRRIFMLDLVFVGLLNASLASCKVAAYLPQSFYFAWTPTGQVPPIPVTEQCGTINIEWSRSSATGPNPSAPYYLQVYTSAYTTAFVIPAGTGLSYDWQVPFAPGTIYQICMFDTNGNTGGCQDTYTMIPSSTNATCANVTAPPNLDAEGLVINGPWSQYGWIDSCTDLSIIPKNGTPPYTLTIAPSLHPPYNITSHTNAPMNWTVSLSWASQFFVSVVDSTGLSWASGPLHSGGGIYSSTGCLSGQPTSKLIKPYIAIASGGGGLLLGLTVGALIAWFFFRRSKKAKTDSLQLLRDSPNFGDSMVRPSSQHLGHDQYRPVPTTSSSGFSNSLSQGGLGYQIEPFSMPNEEGRLYSGISHSHGSGYAPSHSPAPHHLTYEREPSSPTPLQPQNNPVPAQEATPSRPSQVYVVHHDGQTAPVTIYHQEGTQIVELPPRYPPNPSLSPPMTSDDIMTEGRSTSGSGISELRTDSNAQHTLSLHQPRHAGTIRKLPKPGTPQ